MWIRGHDLATKWGQLHDATFTTSGMGEFPPGWVANRCPVEVECVNLMWLNALKKGTQHQGKEKNDGSSSHPSLITALNWVVFSDDPLIPQFTSYVISIRKCRDSLSPSVRARCVPHIHEPSHSPLPCATGKDAEYGVWPYSQVLIHKTWPN